MITNSKPITATQVQDALVDLAAQLSKTDFRMRSEALVQAIEWVGDVAATGTGVPAGTTSPNFHNTGISPSVARIDIEVLRGTPNIVP